MWHAVSMPNMPPVDPTYFVYELQGAVVLRCCGTTTLNAPTICAMVLGLPLSAILLVDSTNAQPVPMVAK